VNKVIAFSEVLCNDGVDGVVISTPAELHYQLPKRHYLQGKMYFVKNHWL